jgi:hypothetical protein
MPRINRFDALGLPPDERDELFRTAPIATKDYASLVDAIHDPNGTPEEVTEYAEGVVAEVQSRTSHTEEATVVNGLRRAINEALESK